jgi:hypothetical protein
VAAIASFSGGFLSINITQGTITSPFFKVDVRVPFYFKKSRLSIPTGFQIQGCTNPARTQHPLASVIVTIGSSDVIAYYGAQFSFPRIVTGQCSFS